MDMCVASPRDMEARRLSPGDFDAVIVTGDGYVDHPAFGAALIARLLESEGFRVAILARPDPDDVAVFRMFGKPRLAFLITAGALDSMVALYTAQRKPRSEDLYAPGGNPSLCMRADGSIGPGKAGRPHARPERATIVYANKCREAYKGVPVIIGGIEASLRRLSHFDYWSESVRRSLLLDAKADVLLYGMAERQILEVMRRLAQGNMDLHGIRGTVWAVHRSRFEEIMGNKTDIEMLPPYETVAAPTEEGRQAFAASFRLQYLHTDPWSARMLVEPCGDRMVVQEPPEYPLSREEMDRVYGLPFTRQSHSLYEPWGGVPALKEVKFSLVSSRGCFGACSFCALAFHQGRVVTSRSIDSLVEEARRLTHLPDFKGYIHDVGGPTANFRQPACDKMARQGACTARRCLAPQPCSRLKADHSEYLALLRRLRNLPGIRKVFIRSGIRFDYLLLDRDPSFFHELVEHHVSGQLKVAPEHVSDRVLALMGKPPHAVFEQFASEYRRLNEELGKRQYLIPYFISSHPGSTLEDALELALWLRRYGFVPDQVQDFYPTPGTLATAMWYTGIDPMSGRQVHVPRGAHERALQRALLQFKKPEFHDLVREALTLLGRTDLIGTGPHCLVPAASGRRGSMSYSPSERPGGGRHGDTGSHQTRTGNGQGPHGSRHGDHGTRRRR